MTLDSLIFDEIDGPKVREAVQRHLRAMEREGGQQATSNALAAAAGLVEFAAYELARDKGSDTVSRLILLSAELDRVAAEYAEAG
ncbi:hypothetical protein [Pseudaestuariivita atlantica]|uniref:Uncharacterized protein n=1 Tax=Pseudaestuariivita atlantica TaxID=1317121 RepID=A0A0L1JU30_9RHOB|nr:hypothetical protein [Pseudaestuariivita atlantica]KNG95260.1 hypothetical protein ATO11_01075 [Pseudaestuariivita atlantica]